ncbi:hypothetical protein [Accumulibacter sp.]|nr:hypothetical protein [Accumulibacter sp.]MCM8596149.1 hypothetical protein [Accumulibacter sp.]MCM8625583.1 hypothetical protein [Accumulibacter sp.]MDS4050298.1 hypothetical protein [Accumulibacter sp.]
MKLDPKKTDERRRHGIGLGDDRWTNRQRPVGRQDALTTLLGLPAKEAVR